MIKDDEEGHLRVLKFNWVFVKGRKFEEGKVRSHVCCYRKERDMREVYVQNRCLIALLRDDFGVFSSKYP